MASVVLGGHLSDRLAVALNHDQRSVGGHWSDWLAVALNSDQTRVPTPRWLPSALSYPSMLVDISWSGLSAASDQSDT